MDYKQFGPLRLSWSREAGVYAWTLSLRNSHFYYKRLLAGTWQQTEGGFILFVEVVLD